MAEGTHFRDNASMADVAWKLVATNLSDLAAKGAEPIGVILGHSLGPDDQAFLDGLHEALTAFETPLMGGDTIHAEGSRTLGLTAIGRATHTPVPMRLASKPGDAIYVTGTIGRAMLGFEGNPDFLEAFNRPTPLLGQGKALAPLVNAMMDVSDGLLLDAFRMAAASEHSFEIQTDLIPVAAPSRRHDCIRWGEDYELLFTAPEAVKLPVPATRIGTVASDDLAPLWLDGEMIAGPENLGYRHG